jgi:hypothetical protein
MARTPYRSFRNGNSVDCSCNPPIEIQPLGSLWRSLMSELRSPSNSRTLPLRPFCLSRGPICRGGGERRAGSETAKELAVSLGSSSRPGGEPFLSDGHAHARGDALSKRAGRSLDSRDPVVLGVTRGFAVELAKAADVFEGHRGLPLQMVSVWQPTHWVRRPVTTVLCKTRLVSRLGR